MTAGMFTRPFDELKPGDRYLSGWRELSGADVDAFATLTGDHHPVHVDADWAGASIFGGRIAHGMLVLSAALGELPLEPERVIALRRLKDVVFKRPLAIDESIRVRCEIAGVRAVDESAGLVDCDWRIEGSDGRLRARARAEVLWSRAPDPVPELPGDDAVDPVQHTPDGLRVYV